MRAFTFTWYALSFWLLDFTIIWATATVLNGTRFHLDGQPYLGFAVGFISAMASDFISNKIHPKKENGSY